MTSTINEQGVLIKEPYVRGSKHKKPFLEQKIMVYTTVKRKHFDQAQKEIRELCKKYR